MGCISSPKVITIEKNTYLIKDKDLYNQRHEKLESLIGRSKSLYDTQKELMSNFNNVEAILQAYEQKALEVKLSKDELKLALLELFAENYIKESLKLKNFDILDYASEILNSQPGIKQSGTKDTLTTMLNHFSRIFPKEQYISILEFDKNDNFEKTFTLKPVFNNYKYNSSYQVQTLTIFLNRFLMSNADYCKQIAEIVEFNKNLTTVALCISDHFETLDDALLTNMIPIIRSVKRNRNIKVITMVTKDNHKLTFKPDVERELLELFHADFLLGFYIGKFGFSDEFVKGINLTLPQLNNLKFFCLDSKYGNLTLLDSLSKALGKNNSIIAVLLAGFPIPADKFKDFKNAQKFNQKLKFFEYESEFFLNI
jgi:hypothetical protein